MKKVVCALLLVMAALLLGGCGKQAAEKPAVNAQTQAVGAQDKQKEKVVVACWGNQMLDSYTQYLC